VRLEFEIVDLYNKIYSTGKYEGEFNVPSEEFAEKIRARIKKLKNKCLRLGGFNYMHCLELLNFAESLLHHLKVMPGILLAFALENLILSKIFLEKKGLSIDVLERASRVLYFIEDLIDRGRMYTWRT